MPAGGGCFEVAVNGEVVYSKLKTGAFPDEQAVLETVRARLKK
ncbi:MAG: SelT/SelW/SelH family protein [Planctomycetes bacterium]|nr:SelT/SelW/SelH family protein [Planctomycetota bacterium]